MWDGVERRRIKHFLYIDDDDSFLKIVTRVCETKSIRCKTTQIATEFISEFETGLYDVALIDYKMSLIDGVTLVRMLDRTKSEKTKIYILTEYDREFIKSKVNGDKIQGIFLKDEGISNILTKILLEIPYESS